MMEFADGYVYRVMVYLKPEFMGQVPVVRPEQVTRRIYGPYGSFDGAADASTPALKAAQRELPGTIAYMSRVQRLEVLGTIGSRWEEFHPASWHPDSELYRD